MTKRIIIAVVLVTLALEILVVIGALFYVAYHQNDAILSSYFLRNLASGLNRPTAIVQPPGESKRLFVAEQTGVVRIFADGKLFAQPFLDVTALVASKALDRSIS